jgi:hypothetical protein
MRDIPPEYGCCKRMAPAMELSAIVAEAQIDQRFGLHGTGHLDPFFFTLIVWRMASLSLKRWG